MTGLGPVAKYMDINRGDNFDFLVSIDSMQANYHRYGREMFTDWRKDYKVTMDVAKLGWTFDVKEDDQTKKNAKSEGLM